MKIEYDPDIPIAARPSIDQIINESVAGPCECGCDEIYVSLGSKNIIDVKCYDCGKSFFELEIEVEEEAIEA
ncbi:MAG: hypothetical protein ACP5J5_01045 [Dissulfurimicrobium sp.]|uniref:hypothetical protein n=1 Tax=Dissulfurimicrobium TaxID=1769732 RepID=UPI001EDA5C94|nr:hypothetical protein [Dissulfurimicrobium hydrothermale]UKL14135.1 hypothetical protein LGS26_02465 [Dissulfurimicrobium hydrothermale]